MFRISELEWAVMLRPYENGAPVLKEVIAEVGATRQEP
jgi:hypothetical protein